MRKMINKYFKSESGSIATSIAILAVPLMCFAGVAIDYASLNNARSNLQEAADAAALASAKELGLVSTKDETVKQVASEYVFTNLQNSLSENKTLSSTEIETVISPSRKDVTVNIAYTWTPMLIQHIDSSALPIKVSSTASLAGEQSVCVLALEQNTSKAIDMGQQATMTANDCVIFSNSTDARGISVFKQSNMSGSHIMSSGGYDGPHASFNPLPITDAPAVEDPLKDRKQPTVGPCDYNGTFVQSNSTLKPGVYCNGLFATGSVEVKLSPGIYIIKDSPLSIQGNASLIGDDVSFFFTGNATFDFGTSTQAVLSASKSGPLAGILFFEDRNSPINRDFTIRSKDAEKFEGAIYLPKGKLLITGKSRVGQKSSWTAIIANRIDIGVGPDIIINSDYANSSIPVPDGISSGSQVRLKR